MISLARLPAHAVKGIAKAILSRMTNVHSCTSIARPTGRAAMLTIVALRNENAGIGRRQ